MFLKCLLIKNQGWTEKKIGLDKEVAENIEKELMAGVKPQKAVCYFFKINFKIHNL